MFPWYREITPTERRTFWSCFGGWGLDALDVQMFSIAIPALIVAFGLDHSQAGSISSVTLVTSAFGGWIAGALSDRYGRVRILQLTILWFSVFTFLCAFAQTATQLFILKGLQGLGFGGEWAAGAVLMGEVVSSRHRGKAVGFVQSGWALGWGAAAILYTVVFSQLPEQTAWRVLFFAGIAPALLVLFIRRNVEEPAVFRAAKASGERGRFLEIFSPQFLRTTVLAALLATGAQGGYYAITTWLPTFLRTERKLSVLNTGGYLGVLIFGSLCGYLVGAVLADRIGRRRNFFVFAIGCMVTVLVYTQVGISDAQMLFLGFPLGFFASGIFSGMGAFLTELFPTRIRGSGQGFTYNFGRGIGALFPSVVGYLSGGMPLGRAIGLFAASAYAVLFVAAVLLPETRGRDLA